MRIFSNWRAPIAPVSTSKHPASGDLGRLLPYNETLETIAARYCVWRSGREPDKPLARRAALAICEAIEIRSQEIVAMEAELDVVLAYDKR